jgi:hypothetical protein
MKKYSKLIAMALILVMLACSFTSCLSYVYRSDSTPKRVAWAIIDIITLPISLLALLIYIIINDASGDGEYQTYLTGSGDNLSSEYIFLMKKIFSLPEAEFAALREILNSVPEAEKSSLMARINSISETERVSLVSAYTSLPESELVSSIERINSLSEAERVSLLQNFISLSEEEIVSLTEELNSSNEKADYLIAEDYPLEKAYAGLSFQY